MMEENIQQIKNEFRELVLSFVKEAMLSLERQDTNKVNIGTYFTFVNIKIGKDGFPCNDLWQAKPRDYKTIFGGGFTFFSGGPLIKGMEFESFKKLNNYVNTTEYIKRRMFVPQNKKDKPSDKETRELFDLVLNIVDRYMHMQQTTELMVSKFDDIFEPISNCIFDEDLHIDIYVPILGIKFNFDEKELTSNVFIKKMDEKFQCSRLQAIGFHTNPVDRIATHAFVLKNWHFKSGHRYYPFWITHNPDYYPLEDINKLLATLRIVADPVTGYSQLIAKPINWAFEYIYDLPSLEYVSTSAFPKKLSLQAHKYPEINENQTKELGELYVKIIKEKNKSLSIAINRLNRCYQRENDEDTLIDAVVGLESLISESSVEIAYKLAIRVAALGRYCKMNKTPAQIFSEIKKIYSMRSAIIHGKEKANKKKEMISKEKIPVEEVILAKEYLRFVIRAVAENPQYLKPKNIDTELVFENKKQKGNHW